VRKPEHSDGAFPKFHEAAETERVCPEMKPGISYIISSTQRSGTHLLCSILRSTGIAGSPGEFFLSKPGETWEKRWGAPSRDGYIERVLQDNTGPNGVFGTVVMWSYFERMLQMLQQLRQYSRFTEAELLAELFNRPKYIWMRRRNRVEQAVSWAMACQTGIWAQGVGVRSQPGPTPKFDFRVIDEWCNRIAAYEASWANYFRENQIEPLVLYYEDVVMRHRAAAERVLEFLGLPLPHRMEMPAPPIEKQANEISAHWAASYRKLKSKQTSKLRQFAQRFRI
jgi:LPS sulfotransferase NodH